jgi:hypothetical protein
MDNNHHDDIKVGWRVGEWAHAVGLSRATTFNLLAAGTISGVKSGNARIITTAPRDYLKALAGDAA